jgi:hypothetical protein
MGRIVRKRKAPAAPSTPLQSLMEKHLEDLLVKNYSEYTIKGRRVHINLLPGLGGGARDRGAGRGHADSA